MNSFHTCEPHLSSSTTHPASRGHVNQQRSVHAFCSLSSPFFWTVFYPGTGWWNADFMEHTGWNFWLLAHSDLNVKSLDKTLGGEGDCQIPAPFVFLKKKKPGWWVGVKVYARMQGSLTWNLTASFFKQPSFIAHPWLLGNSTSTEPPFLMAHSPVATEYFEIKILPIFLITRNKLIWSLGYLPFHSFWNGKKNSMW